MAQCLDVVASESIRLVKAERVTLKIRLCDHQSYDESKPYIAEGKPVLDLGGFAGHLASVDEDELEVMGVMKKGELREIVDGKRLLSRIFKNDEGAKESEGASVV